MFVRPMVALRSGLVLIAIADHRNCFVGDTGEPSALPDIESEFGKSFLPNAMTMLPPFNRSSKKARWYFVTSAYGTPVRQIRHQIHVLCSHLSIHHIGMNECPAEVVLPNSARERVQGWAQRTKHPIDYAAHFVPAELDHRAVKFNPNFSSTNKGLLKMLPNPPKGVIFGHDDE